MVTYVQLCSGDNVILTIASIGVYSVLHAV